MKSAADRGSVFPDTSPGFRCGHPVLWPLWPLRPPPGQSDECGDPTSRGAGKACVQCPRVTAGPRVESTARPCAAYSLAQTIGCQSIIRHGGRVLSTSSFSGARQKEIPAHCARVPLTRRQAEASPDAAGTATNPRRKALEAVSKICVRRALREARYALRQAQDKLAPQERGHSTSLAQAKQARSLRPAPK